MPESDFNQIITNLTSGNPSFPSYIWQVIAAIYFLYILIYAFLQIRQVKVMQKRLSTDADGIMTYVSYGYIFLQFLIFVVTLLML